MNKDRFEIAIKGYSERLSLCLDLHGYDPDVSTELIAAQNIITILDRKKESVDMQRMFPPEKDIDHVVELYGDMVPTWEDVAAHDNDTFSMTIAAAKGSPIYNRAENDRLRAAEEKSNEDSLIDIFTNAEQTEAGNADLFTSQHVGEYLYNKSLGWLVWNGKKWAEGDGVDAYVKSEASAFTRDMYNAASSRQAWELENTGEVSKSSKARMQHAIRSRSKKGIDAIVGLNENNLYRAANTFDADPNVLNTPAGIVDLCTGDVRPHDREAYCTKITKATPSDKGRAKWGDFVNLICCDDPEMVCYLQEVIGSTLFGRVVTEGLYIAVGDGFNGKSTFFNALRAVLGDYAGTLDSDVLTSTNQSKDAKLSTVRGKRLMICGELQEGAALSENFVKKITSTDNIQIKALYKNPEEITPTHSIMLHTNNLPRINTTDMGTWRRIHLIPFNAKMPQGRATIRDYADRLVADCGGAILQWAIEGAISASQQGFNIDEPAAVSELLDRYRAGQDQVNNFVTEMCVTDPTQEEGAKTLYEAYRAYCMTIGETAKTAAIFKSDMRRLGYRHYVSNTGNKWLGIRLNPAKIAIDSEIAENP